ncbi:MAG TPA: hypothetical protein VK058_03705 [Paenalcaligenes sp.]|nr:hypothetical protein [Paenalcaligenes sp.]
MDADISQAKDPFLRNSFEALKRAAQLAREEAIRTNTGIVVLREGRVVKVPAETLRMERQAEKD